MRYGFSLPVPGDLADHDGIVGIARYADGRHPLGTVAIAEPRPPAFSAMLADLKRMTEAGGRYPRRHRLRPPAA